jgi:DNA helicase-2/ATP-dependent DNA helicase PcrA
MNVSVLNKRQQKAKTHTNKPLLIIAGLGSGKTFSLIERISYLVSEKKVKPENILIRTFTEKVAKEITTTGTVPAVYWSVIK